MHELGSAVDLKSNVNFLMRLQRFNYINSRYEVSYNYGLDLLSIVEDYDGDDKLIILSRVNRFLAIVCDMTGDIELALKYAKKACDYAVKSGDNRENANTLVTLAVIHENSEDYNAQLELFQKALHYYEELGNKDEIALIKNNLADTHRKLKKYAIAENLISDALRIEEENGITYRYPSYLNTAGVLFYDQNRLEDAKRYLLKAIEVYHDFNNTKAQVNSYMRLGSVLWKLQDFEASEYYIYESLKLAKENKLSKYEYLAHKELTNIFEESSHFERAYNHLRQYIEIRDKVIDERTSRRFKMEQIAYESKLAKREAALAKREAELAKLKSKYLEQQVASHVEELLITQDVTIQTIAALAETRDTETGNHISRTMMYVKTLASLLKESEDFKDQITEDMSELLHKSAQLHDIGKVGVPDSILLKPGKLTEEEFEEMKKHTEYGRNALQIAENALGDNSFMKYAREIAFTHHEKWDGSGYPLGLKDEDIPLSGRIMAFADVYDALISERPYKRAFTHEEAISIIENDLGTHFDPRIGALFMSNHKMFEQIAKDFDDAVEQYMPFEK